MQAKRVWKNIRELNSCGRSEPKKIGTFYQVLSKVKVILFIFFLGEDILFIFSIFKVEHFFPKSASPFPSESNGRPLTNWLTEVDL